MKLSHTKLIVLSGLIWFAIGVYLLQLGLGLLLGTLHAGADVPTPLIHTLSPWIVTAQTAVLGLILLGLFIGYFKGRYVLGKSAKRGVSRILSFPSPVPLSKIYSLKYYLLLGLMVGLGVSIKFLGIHNDIRGFIDVAIGAALINGAAIYFQCAQTAKAQVRTSDDK